MANHITELIAALMQLAAGIFCLVKKRFSFGIGGGRSGLAGPLFTVHLSGSRAVLFGVASVAGALIALIPWLHVYFTNNVIAMSDQTLPFVAICGLVVAALGFVISSFLELLYRVRIRADSEKNNPARND